MSASVPSHLMFVLHWKVNELILKDLLETFPKFDLSVSEELLSHGHVNNYVDCSNTDVTSSQTFPSCRFHGMSPEETTFDQNNGMSSKETSFDQTNGMSSKETSFDQNNQEFNSLSVIQCYFILIESKYFN
jgi:hypothetical protein